jgi:hypothetical protein
MKHPFLLFHWSPKSRRPGILRYGLCPNKLSRCRQWRPPYVCFCRNPSLAWACSAVMHGKPILWDLWMIWSSAVPKGYETLVLFKGPLASDY